jgi:peptidoglycan-associated lipoprotein
MARRILVPALLMGTLSLIGCTPEYPKCEKDEHCKDHNEVCVNGQCQECGRDSDCASKPGFICREMKCVPKPECSATERCQAGFKCVGEKCVAGCDLDQDCGQGLRCKAGQCAPPECASDADCTEGKHCVNSDCVAREDSGACSLQTVHFDFNEHALTAEARGVLDTDAQCLRTHKGAKVTLAGHADERGTEDYNLHLSEKRANSVKKYLSTLGIEESRLSTVAYGEEKPANAGHDEAAWAENRRVELSE